MRIAIRHEINYRYERPAQWMLRVLRVTPWAIDNQHLDQWRVDLDCDCRVRRGDDAFGNIVHSLSADAPVTELSVVAHGEIVTTDNAGVLRNALERFPPAFYLRDTEATTTNEAVRDFATKVTKTADTPLAKLHALLSAVCDEIEVVTSDAPMIPVGEALAEGKGTPRDLTHLFIAAARHIGAPARFISGCYVPLEGAEEAPREDAAHVWAEAHVPDLGWIGFDPTFGFCTHEGHVRIAMALDHLGAMPIRGAQTGGGDEVVSSSMRAHDARIVRRRQERSFHMSQDQFQK
jgi:transglutaminase-like putative cysteine protease